MSLPAIDSEGEGKVEAFGFADIFLFEEGFELDGGFVGEEGDGLEEVICAFDFEAALEADTRRCAFGLDGDEFGGREAMGFPICDPAGFVAVNGCPVGAEECFAGVVEFEGTLVLFGDGFADEAEEVVG